MRKHVTALDRKNTRLQTDLAARKQLSEDTATTPSLTADGVPLPPPKPAMIAQLRSYQHYELAVSGVVILSTKITEARLVNDTPVFRLLTQPLTRAHSGRIFAAIWQSGFSCMLRERR